MGGVTPHSAGKVVMLILSSMKSKQRMGMTFGDLIAAAYQVWGVGSAEKMVRSVLNKRLVAFHQPRYFSIFAGKGRLV
jgi:hypothetical protein